MSILIFSFCLYFLFSFFRIILAAGMVEKERSRRLTTATLNQVVREAVAFKPPPRTRGGKRGRVYYCTQVLVQHPEHSMLTICLNNLAAADHLCMICHESMEHAFKRVY